MKMMIMMRLICETQANQEIDFGETVRYII